MTCRVSSSLLPVALALALAAGCESIPEVKVPEKVLVQVPVACVEAAKRPKAPELRTEAHLMAMDRGRRTLAAWSDLKKHETYMALLEAIVEACSRIPPSR